MTPKDAPENKSMYYPSKEILKSSRVKDYDCLYKESVEDRERFWDIEAKKLMGIS